MTQRIPTKRLESAAPIPSPVIEDIVVEEEGTGKKEVVSPVAI